MSKALSLDLRNRVLSAVAGGMSGRQAGRQFKVSAASVSRWRALERRQGDARPGPLGGDRRSKRIESHADVILALLDETKDITLEELRATLADRGLSFGYGTLWRFFHRRGIIIAARHGSRGNWISIPPDLSLSTRPGPAPTWPGVTGAAASACA